MRRKITKEEFKKKADASYTSINDLILRRKKIKAAILNSNAVTKINMHEKEMTIAEVIDLKGMIVYYKSLLNKMITQRDISVAKVNVNNSKVEAYIDKMVSDAYSNKDGKNIIKPEEYAAIADPYRERNEWVLVDPLGITEKIESLQNFIEEFEKLKTMRDKKLFYGLGVSVFNPDEDFMKDPEAFTIYLSLLGLSCELYIKSLLYQEQEPETVSWKSGHNLSELFEKLTKSMQLKVQSDFARYFPELHFQEELKKVDLFFRKFRYAYELDGYSVNLYIAQVILRILKSL